MLCYKVYTIKTIKFTCYCCCLINPELVKPVLFIFFKNKVTNAQFFAQVLLFNVAWLFKHKHKQIYFNFKQS